MPIFKLNSEVLFPPPEMADESGILAVGGDLSAERLLEAYRKGIFPWYSEGQPLLWWSPDPRFVLFPEELVISKSMRKVLRQKRYAITINRCFRDVITACGQAPRHGQDGTWITPEMIEAYCELHRLGYAHSVESWKDGVLAGGLYGVSLGRCFFGESMFSRMDNASKAALITLTVTLLKMEFHIIDSQVHTPHLESLGAREIPRTQYIEILQEALQYPDTKDFHLLTDW